MSSLKKAGIELLWEAFTNKIQKEWRNKYVDYGTDINNINSPTKFAQAVYADMETYFKETRRNVKLVNSLTLHRYFMQGGFSPRIKAGTLDLFSMYLGCGMFTDFVKENKRKIVRTANAPDTPSSITVKKTKRRWLFFAAASILMVLIAWGSWNIFSSTRKPTLEEKQEIENLIHNAAKLKFQVLENDTVSMAKLTDYYIAEGTAIKDIKADVERIVIGKNRKMRPGGYYEIFHIEKISISGDEATLKTKEKWRMFWYNIETNKNEVAYDVLNIHTYHLKKIDGKWKIYHNDYSGKLEPTVD